MLDPATAATNPLLVREYIFQQLALKVSKAEGYDWPDDRFERIAKDACSAVAEGVPDQWAFSSAYCFELDMYGGHPIPDFVGFICPSR